MTKEDMLALLREKGVQSVEITYNGYGDEGSIDEVTTVPPEAGLQADMMTEFACDQLAQLPFDWINNEGGFGRMTINVGAGTIVVAHNQRYEASKFSHHEL